MTTRKEKLYITFITIFIVVSCIFISPEGVQNQSTLRSLQLQTISVSSGDIEIIDFVDKNGKIAVAADKGYATCEIISKGNKKYYSFYNDKGEKVSRYPGYFGLIRVYDNEGNNISVTYLNNQDEPCVIEYGYAIEKKTYNEKGQCIFVRYYDTECKPILTAAYGNGINHEYDEKGNNIRSTFVNVLGQPIVTSKGYASIIRHFYSIEGKDQNKVESEFYFDEKGQHKALSLGQYGVHKEYDQNGLESIITYLDIYGNPMITNKGYTTVKKTYQANNFVATERYFDLNGKPCALSEGQYGISRKGNQVNYLDINGNEMFSLRRLLYNQSWIVVFISVAILFVSFCMCRERNVMLLIMYFVVILYLTLLFREIRNTRQIGVVVQYKNILADWEYRADIFRNIWLFFPLGAILYQLYPKYYSLLISLMISILIEGLQYILKIGACELVDILSNCLGGIIGFSAGKLMTKIKLYVFG